MNAEEEEKEERGDQAEISVLVVEEDDLFSTSVSCTDFTALQDKLQLFYYFSCNQQNDICFAYISCNTFAKECKILFKSFVYKFYERFSQVYANFVHGRLRN